MSQEHLVSQEQGLVLQEQGAVSQEHLVSQEQGLVLQEHLPTQEQLAEQFFGHGL